MELKKVIISGGGTGGHIFPAIAIANEIKSRFPNCAILFVGAEGKMEMEKVPAAGYEIKGLPIVGFQRKFALKNLLLPFKLLKSLSLARRIVKEFNPQLVIGVGGYASGPTLKMAQRLAIPTVIQEQNSYPGKTNRLLAKDVKAVCTAYEGLESVFGIGKVTLTGNPVRKELQELKLSKAEALHFFPSLDENKKTILLIGGSLGAKTLNESVLNSLALILQNDVQLIWQCGKYYFEELKKALPEEYKKNILLTDFIPRMDAAYTLADVVVSRAGALSISELCLVGKPTVFVPSPNVSDDHQTKNALAITKNNAALLVKDSDAIANVFPLVLDVLKDSITSISLAENIKKLAKPNASSEIVDVILKQAKA